MRPLFLLLMSFVGHLLTAQPAQIYSFQVLSETGGVRLTDPKILTSFNLNGVNDDPFFFSPSELYITVRPARDTTRSDLYVLDLVKGTKLRLTATVEEELIPGPTASPYYFSAVRIERDEDRTRRLWQFPIDRVDSGKPVFATIRNIGGYTWMNSKSVLLYIPGAPSLLLQANPQDGSFKKIAADIGPCLQKLPNGKVVFVKKESRTNWVLTEMDLSTLETRPLVNTLTGSEYFTVLADGGILMGNGSKIFHFQPNKTGSTWTEIADLSGYKVRNITKMAVSAGGVLAVVGR